MKGSNFLNPFYNIAHLQGNHRASHGDYVWEETERLCSGCGLWDGLECSSSIVRFVAGSRGQM